MSDLIERLRKWNIHDDGTLDGGRVMRDMREAADEIERLTACIEEHQSVDLLQQMEIERQAARIEESRKVVTDLMQSHDELMAGVGAIVVDYVLLNECRIAGDKYLAATEQGESE